MAKTQQVQSDILEFLQRTDTCVVSNAIEALNVRMRNEGYVHSVSRCRFPQLPPISGPCYYHRTDWWKYCASVPGPKIIVIEDLDRVPGIGALFGEMHARIGRALGCVGYLTNGTIRGGPVNIGGSKISTGDLLHGDLNGIHSIPAAVIDRLPAAVEKFEAREAEFIKLCQDRDFPVEKLQQAIRDPLKSNPRPDFH